MVVTTYNVSQVIKTSRVTKGVDKVITNVKPYEAHAIIYLTI